MTTDVGCACNKGSSGQSIAQAGAARRGSLAAPGSIESSPMLLGDEDGVVRRFRVVTVTPGFRVGNAYWLTGCGVEHLIEQGSLVEITGVQQKARQFKAGPFTYSDPNEALRVANALGTTPIEVA